MVFIYSAPPLLVGEIVNKPFSYPAGDSRFKAYLDESRLTQAETLHGFRSGCAIILALTGTDLQSIMGHVDWHRQSTASYYSCRKSFPLMFPL